MALVIRGLGTSLPGQPIDQEDALEVARRVCCRTDEQAALLPALYRQTGIEKRHMALGAEVMRDVLRGTRQSGSAFLPNGAGDDRGPGTAARMRVYGQEALPLALHAARSALAASGIAGGEVTHVVTVSCTGFQAPGVDIGLIRELGLPADSERVHVGFMGCHGAINGLRVASAIAGAEPTARILLCAVELCSLHYYYAWAPKQLVANALFADGAAALVGCAPLGDGEEAWRLTATGSCLFPNSQHAMTWSVGDHGFEMTLSTGVPGMIETHLRPWLESWLRRMGLAIGEVASWAVHPGGPRILSAVEAGLDLNGMALGTSRAVLKEHGNMSSPTVLFILDRLRRARAARPCVALSFGPGLVAEAALFR
jgi:predicted naringenin-chalcone synthase